MMKIYSNKLSFVLLIVLGITLFSCELDNYEGPDASIYGTFYDTLTNEPVGMDIVNGTLIQYVEQGFENPQNQYLVIKTDGTYRNNLMFSGNYSIELINTNFSPVEPFDIEIKGETKLDFKVIPYIRFKDVSIQKNGNKIVANFKLYPTVDAKVRFIGLFGHPNSSVGTNLRTVGNNVAVDDKVQEGTEFSIELDVPANMVGKKMYFRVGSKIDINPSRWNYAPPVEIIL